MQAQTINEPYVDCEAAGKFLGMSAAHVRRLAEKGLVRAYNYGVGKRRFWRFRLSELELQVCLPSSSVSRGQE